MNGTQQLLAEYARTRSESAFRELVSGYVDLVYSTALRRVNGDAHRAQDISQVVFSDLAAQAAGLPSDVMLGGWLHRHTCFVAAKTIRGERRRLAREKEAAAMNRLNEEPDLDFSRVAPLLDESINQLGEEDRAAILLRFFEQKDYEAVGQQLNSTGDAARMRVNRAVDKLRDLLRQRGIRTTAAALSAAIATNAAHAAPAGLANSLATTALSGITTGLITTTTTTTTTTIAMTAFQKIAVTAALTITIGAGIYEAKQVASARTEVQKLQTQQAAQATEMARLRTEDSQLSNLVMQAKEQKQLTAAQFGELLKLRGQATASQKVTQLENDPAVQKAEVWLAKEKKIRDQFELHPEQKIPEMQFLTEEDWLDHARHAEVDTEQGMRIAMSNIRATASGIFADKMTQAIALYLAAHQQKLPDSASDLADYFHPPLKDADAVLARYVRSPTNPDIIIGGPPQLFEQDRAAVIDPIDSRVTFSSNTVTWLSPAQMPPLPDELEPLVKAYVEAHHIGFMSIYDLRPFATTPEQKAALEKMIDAMNPNRGGR